MQDKVVVDLKVADGFNSSHIAQMIGYLAIPRLELGLLLNFRNVKLDWKRIARSTNI